MATSSIFRNIVIDDERSAELFLEALERSASRETAGHELSYPVKDVTGDDIERMLDRFVI